MTLRLTCKLLFSSITRFYSFIYRKVGNMSEKAMDEYIEFCGRVLAKNRKVVEGEDDKELEEEEAQDIRVAEGLSESKLMCLGAKSVGVPFEYLAVIVPGFERQLSN